MVDSVIGVSSFVITRRPQAEETILNPELLLQSLELLLRNSNGVLFMFTMTTLFSSRSQ